MIISHKHRFIFIHTEKTAGTSIDLALSKYLGESDIIAPFGGNADDRLWRQLGYRVPQNFWIPYRSYGARDWARLLVKGRKLGYAEHSSAAFIKRHIGDEIWNSYFKFCFERNPWDKVVSWYYFKNPREPRPSLNEFIDKIDDRLLRGHRLYTIDGVIAVDKIFRFERLPVEMETLASILKLPEVPQLPHAMGKFRKDKRPYQDLLSSVEREKIARLFEKEIALFSYQW